MWRTAVRSVHRTAVSVPSEGERFRGLYVVVRQPPVRHGGDPLLEAKLRLPLVAAVRAAEAQHGAESEEEVREMLDDLPLSGVATPDIKQMQTLWEMHAFDQSS
jgi:hypothetical protein